MKKSYINESPDYIKKLNLNFNDDQSIPVTFFINKGVIVYSTETQSHYHMENVVNSLIRMNYKKPVSFVKEKLEQKNIFILNETETFYHPSSAEEFFKEVNKNTKNNNKNEQIVTGRLFGVDKGYISFWQKPEIVIKNIDFVNQFIKKIGGNPQNVIWEITDFKNNKSKLVSYDEFIKQTNNIDDELERQKEIAKHTIAGMRGLTTTDYPSSPKIDLETKYKTTIGDSFNYFNKMYEDIINEQRVFSFDGRYGYTEVIKNPSLKEIKSVIKNNRSSAMGGIIIVDQNEFYVFNRDNEFHGNVAKKLNLKDYIGGLYNGDDYFFVSDSTSSRFKENPIVVEIIKNIFPKVKEIDFYNQSIVGDWSNLGNPFSESLGDYRGVHKAPSKSYGAPLHDLTQIYPDDIYSDNAARYYGDNRGDGEDQKTINLFKSLKGKPEKLVKIYRAVPKKENGKYSINEGDWVTVSKKYAIEHGQRHLDKYDIVYKLVPAKTLYTDANSLYEFGYNP
jgi:hypothetical protein